jgi:AbrB family looped-hinge helix DNA binding protein
MMVSIVRVTGSGQITIPAEMRRKHHIETGDRVMISENAEGRLEVRPISRSAREIAGKFRLKPGVMADNDFGNVIREATEEYVDRIMAQMDDQRVPE